MLKNIYCIALRTVKVNDSRNLLSVWSDEYGRMSVVMPSGNSREARCRRALTSPLSLFEAVADVRADRDVVTVRDLMPLPQSPGMNLSPMRVAGAAFIAEALDVLLRRSEADPALSAFLFDALAFYGEADSRSAANFIVFFFFHLARFLGIVPELEGEVANKVIDLREGRVVSSVPLHGDYLAGADFRTAIALSRVPLRRCGLINIARFERRRALDVILHYYEMHLASLESLKSLEILRQIFD